MNTRKIDKPDRKAIGKNLQKLRKEAGFKSAAAFAKHVGVNPNTYTQYEQGLVALSYERAWEFADILECSLDELGGREFTPSSMELSDEGRELLRDFNELNDKGRDKVLGYAEDLSGNVEYRVSVKKSVEDPPLPQASAGVA